MLPVIPILPFQSLPGKVWLHHRMNERWISFSARGLESPCQHSCAGTDLVEMCHLLEESFFLDDMAMRTPSYLSLLLGFVKTGPANIEANNLDRQCSPPCFSFLKSSCLMTRHTSLLVRDGKFQIPIPTASWELLYSNHSTAAFQCHTDTRTELKEPCQQCHSVGRGPETTFIIAAFS